MKMKPELLAKLRLSVPLSRACNQHPSVPPTAPSSAANQAASPCHLLPVPPAGNQLPVQKALVGDGPLDKVLASVVEDNNIGLLALQLPPGTKAMPQHMLALLRSCRCVGVGM